MTGKCEKCGGELYRDEVDIGVGTQYSPWNCSVCGWSEGNDEEIDYDPILLGETTSDGHRIVDYPKPVLQRLPIAETVSVDEQSPLGMETDDEKTRPIQSTFYWQPGPAMGVDVLDPNSLDSRPPGFECGDRLLVLVACISNGFGREQRRMFWDCQIIIPTETGFDDQNGDSWGAWNWSDVSWWVKLDKKVLPEVLK